MSKVTAQSNLNPSQLIKLQKREEAALERKIKKEQKAKEEAAKKLAHRQMGSVPVREHKAPTKLTKE